MKPYYDDGKGIQIFCADCREILPSLPKVDLVLTDPPYPGLKGNVKVTFNMGLARRYDDCETVGEPWGSDISALSMLQAEIGYFVFCSWQSVEKVLALVPGKRAALITWFKRNSQPSNNNAPHYQTELIVANRNTGGEWRKIRTMYDIPKLQGGCCATERLTDEKGKSLHPTQKPLALIKSLMDVGGDTILDPFMGSGTTLRAAKDLGRKAIGIEIEERYCEIAANRLAQEVLEFAS